MTDEMDDEQDATLRDQIERDSDHLLTAVDEIRRLELEKRKVPMSTPEFHVRADDIERRSRAVFGLAAAEREHGEALSETQDRSIDDEAAEDEAAEDEPTDAVHADAP